MRSLTANTIISFTIRTAVLVDVSILGLWVYANRAGGTYGDYVPLEMLIARGGIGILIIADWATRRDPERRFSKLADTLVVLVWFVLTSPIFLMTFSAIGYPAP